MSVRANEIVSATCERQVDRYRLLVTFLDWPELTNYRLLDLSGRLFARSVDLPLSAEFNTGPGLVFDSSWPVMMDDENPRKEVE